MSYTDKKKQSEYQQRWMLRRRKKWLDTNGPCPCRSSIDLEVDHIDPSKKIDHKVWSWSPQRMATELAKCQVLCSECHKKKTAASYIPPKHGTNSRYTNRGGRVANRRCRCASCRRAHAIANAAYR